MIAEVLVLLGALLTLLAGVGVLRFGDALARMHAVTKASTLGVVLVVVGAALALDNPNDITSLLLAGALQLLTSPVSGNLLSRTTYLAEGIPNDIDAVDELAERRRRGQA
ncbi:MAG: Na+/H+ antiporter subunit G [Acidimicrobiia bacterium]|nr:Na+/H+ antiporter subunit G [Acidimicrobiia bacterium]